MTNPGSQPTHHPAGFLAGVALSFVALTGMHEAMLRVSGHEPAIVDDEALWCAARLQVAAFGPADVVLLGASRMQTDISEQTLAECLPGRRIVNLAISAGGTSLPVFRDIVEQESFAGTVILDETEASMASDGTEQAYADAFHHTFTLDRLINRAIETWLQHRLICLAPEESCVDFWPWVAATGRPPRPRPRITSAARYTQAISSRIDPDFLEVIRRRLLPGPADPAAVPELMDGAVARWLEPVESFRRRGGRAIFVRLPVSHDRWERENAGETATAAWRGIMDRLGCASLICNASDSSMPPDVRVPDGSHLEAADTDRFTRWLCDQLRPMMKDSRPQPPAHRSTVKQAPGPQPQQSRGARRRTPGFG